MEKEIVKASLNEAGRKALRVNPDVNAYITPLIFQSGRMVKLKKDELRFLKAIADSENVEEAVRRSGISLERYRSLLRRKDFREVVADRIEEIALRRGVTADWWLTEGMKVWSGAKKVDFNQMSVWKEIGARVKPREKAGGGGEKVSININLDRFIEAKERQRVIDAEVIKGGKEE